MNKFLTSLLAFVLIATLALAAGTKEYGNYYFLDGNVGIGTTGPGAKLEVAGGDALILDSTELGSDLVSGWDFTSGWSIYTGTIDDLNSFTTTGAGGVYHNSIVTYVKGKRYSVRIAGTTGASSLGFYTGTGGADRGVVSSGAFDTTLEFTVDDTDANGIYLRNAGAGTTDISTLTVKEVTGGDLFVNGIITGIEGTSGIKVLGTGNVGIGTTDPDTLLDVAGAITQRELAADPTDPDEGSNVIWQSDGTGSGGDGDIYLKAQAGASIKTLQLYDFSTNLLGAASTVGTITGLAPDTATTQATQASITSAANLVTVGTIGTGTWASTDVGIAYGGTGASTASTALSNLGGIGATTTHTLTNKTYDANAAGNSLSNVDVADLSNGTDGELITWSAAGVAATVGVGTADQVLTSNGAGAAPTFQAAAGGGITTNSGLLTVASGASTGTTNYAHGLGSAPSSIIFNAVSTSIGGYGTANSNGVVDDDLDDASTYIWGTTGDSTGKTGGSSTYSIVIESEAAAIGNSGWLGQVSAVDATNFTITWTKGSTRGLNISVAWLATK